MYIIFSEVSYLTVFFGVLTDECYSSTEVIGQCHS